MLPIEKAPDKSTDAAPTLTRHRLPAPTDADVVDQVAALVDEIDPVLARKEEEDYYKDICTSLEKVQNSLQTKTGFKVTAIGATVVLTSFFLTTGQHAYVADALVHSPRFVIPEVLLVIVAWTTPFVVFAALAVLAVAQWPGSGEGENDGLDPIRPWHMQSPKGYEAYRAAIEASASLDNIKRLDMVRHRTYNALRNLGRKTSLNTLATKIYCILLCEIAFGVLSAATLLLSAIHR